MSRVGFSCLPIQKNPCKSLTFLILTIYIYVLSGVCPFLSFHSTIEQSLAPHPCSEAFHQDPFVHSPT